MTAEPRNVRDRILDAALSVLRESGKKFAQPQVAKAAGVPQGHLTYYFPRRLDLLVGVVQRFAQSAADEVEKLLSEHGAETGKAARQLVLALTRRLIKDRERTRTLLALVVESDADPQVREGMADHTERLLGLLGHFLQRRPDDPDVAIALAALWGLGLQHLMLGHRRSEAETDAIIDRLTQWLGNLPPAKSAKDASPRPKASPSPGGHTR